ncbi:MAG: methyltransferase domain-containing protein [Actinobacteria bacterium]|nr:methyltransferase domain-containing protein [Actinomycetota bacterium]
MIGWLYDLLSERSERAGIEARRRELLAPLEGDVLEVGVGTGRNLPHYVRARRVVAIEPDSGMAKRLPERLAAAKIPVEVVSASAERLPFPDASFDAAVSTFVFCSVDDPAVALAEIHRVLRPGGRFILMEHVRGDGRTARWQDRLTPLHRRLAGNCRLNRDTRAAVASAGFDTREVRAAELPASHPLVRPSIYGVAIKTSS